jgi:hypothetical protein
MQKEICDKGVDQIADNCDFIKEICYKLLGFFFFITNYHVRDVYIKILLDFN